MFTAKWKKEAKLLEKGARKFVNYKRDLLKPERIAEIDSRRKDLLDAVAANDREKAQEASKRLRASCDGALPFAKAQNGFEENIEVMFVAVVIALGLRAYYLQPFRIPTGSMQPTLNGITGTPLDRAEWPGLPQRLVEKVLRGRSYVYVENDRDRQLVARRDIQYWHFFSRSELLFSDGSKLRLPAPLTPSNAISPHQLLRQPNPHLKAGQVICEGYIDSGDLVLVDKFSYHFRKPKRGEVFVFDTLGIQGIHDRSGDQAAGSHYIKRLCGVPGDTLEIQSPDVLIDGKVAREPGIQRVAEAQGEYAQNPEGYVLADRSEPLHYRVPPSQYLAAPGSKMALAAQAPPGMREYAALGDNTGNSLDSRYWGPVKEFNLVGPALFSLWPVTTGHWGFIR